MQDTKYRGNAVSAKRFYKTKTSIQTSIYFIFKKITIGFLLLDYKKLLALFFVCYSVS